MYTYNLSTGDSSKFMKSTAAFVCKNNKTRFISVFSPHIKTTYICPCPSSSYEGYFRYLMSHILFLTRAKFIVECLPVLNLRPLQLSKRNLPL